MKLWRCKSFPILYYDNIIIFVDVAVIVVGFVAVVVVVVVTIVYFPGCSDFCPPLDPFNTFLQIHMCLLCLKNTSEVFAIPETLLKGKKQFHNFQSVINKAGIVCFPKNIESSPEEMLVDLIDLSKKLYEILLGTHPTSYRLMELNAPGYLVTRRW